MLKFIMKKNHSSDVNNQNLEQIYIDKLEKFESARIYAMVEVNDRSFFEKLIFVEPLSLLLDWMLEV